MGAAEALFFAHPFWVWIALGGVFLIGELMTGSGWLLWPAGAGGRDRRRHHRLRRSAGPSRSCSSSSLAIVATYLGRRFLPPAGAARASDINDPAPRLVGQQGEAAAPSRRGSAASSSTARNGPPSSKAAATWPPRPRSR